MIAPPSAAPAGETIHRLIEICREAQTGYGLAARAVSDLVLRAEMMQYSRQRTEFVAELQEACRQLNEPHTDTTAAEGRLGPIWDGLKSAGNDRQAVLGICRQADARAVELYRQSLGSGLPMKVAAMVHTQFAAITRVRDRLASLLSAGT
jgi:uncharacterized protein (TIGR02284 family)